MTAREFIRIWNDNRDYVECRTSGSTGVPKVIKLSKADMTKSALSTIEFFGLQSGANYVCPIPFDYIGGRMMAVRSIVGNGNLIEIPPSNNFTLQDFHSDLLAIVPSQIPALLMNDIKNLGDVIVGGAPVSDGMRNEIAKSGIRAWQTYGMTETASHVALARITADTPVYNALPGVSFETDERDCLIIIRPGFDSTRIVTNDVVEIFSPTSFTWLGRYDDVINSGGVKILPEELERKICEILPELTERCLVRKRLDSKWGEVPELIVESSVFTDIILNKLRASLDSKISPRHIIEVAELPRTLNGKPKRR